MNMLRFHNNDDRLRITSAQINPTIGDIDGNIALMLEAARKARHEDSDLIVFPELSLTGYYPADLLDDERFQARLAMGREALKTASRETPDLHWVVGLPLVREKVEGQGALHGKKFSNALMVLLDGQVVTTYAKQLLPTYNVFDERRHFEPGPDVARVFRIGSTQVGLLICEDGWNDAGADYGVNPFNRLSDAKPDLIVSINASPSNIGKREQRHRIFSASCARHGIPLLYVNQVGGHDQLVYDGASFAMNGKGEVMFEANRFSQDITTLSFQPVTGQFYGTNGGELPAVAAVGMSTMEFYRQQIILGLKDYARRCGFTKVVVGSSGGIDSALTLALAVEALGAANVSAITMPSAFSSVGSVSDSAVLCANLGIKLDEFPIGGVINEFSSSMQTSTLATLPSGLALENLQARMRGTLLMTYSNLYGHLVLTTGNKSEISVGYCTLYGDTNGGLGLIGDLYKTEVFALARHINATASREIIPQAIIDKPPSAELAPGQADTDSLPPYDVLDAILRLEIEPDHLAPEEKRQATETVKALGPDSAVVARIRKMIQRNEYKRRQAPPILRVRGRAFGAGRQLPIAAVYG